MSISGNRTRLEALTKELLRNWAATEVAWKDARSEAFDREYLQGLATRVHKTGQLLDKLDAVLRKVKDDCE